MINLENSDIKTNKEAYIHKANKFLKVSIFVLLFDISTYLIAYLIFNSFDFGLIFEIASLLMTSVALYMLHDENYFLTKVFIVLAMTPILIIISYDIYIMFVNIEQIVLELFSSILFSYFPYLSMDITLIFLLKLLYDSYSSIKKTETQDLNESYYMNNK